MLRTRAYAAQGSASPLAPHVIERREPGPDDVLIDIEYCGLCHSDIHQVRDEWGGSIYPMVPGHEIVGRVAATGSNVRGRAASDRVGVGVFIDSCRVCDACRSGEGQYWERGMSPTYNGYEQDGVTPTYGGYAERITVHQDYVLTLPDALDPARAAPLLCAGITTYSPIRHFGARAGEACAVVGLGGLGHMAVKFLRALGMQVTVISHSARKRVDALALGADDFLLTSDDGTLARNERRFDLIIDTVSAAHDYNAYLRTLRRDGAMVLVGLPDPAPVDAGVLVTKRRRLAGSMIGGIPETQEMLDLCAERDIVADIELIPIQRVNEAFERTLASDVRYRFVIDMESLRAEVGEEG